MCNMFYFTLKNSSCYWWLFTATKTKYPVVVFVVLLCLDVAPQNRVITKRTGSLFHSCLSLSLVCYNVYNALFSPQRPALSGFLLRRTARYWRGNQTEEKFLASFPSGVPMEMNDINIHLVDKHYTFVSEKMIGREGLVSHSAKLGLFELVWNWLKRKKRKSFSIESRAFDSSCE